MTDKRLIKSYVWFGDKCFFVSTADRDSSAMLGPRRFAETIVWEFDWEKDERGKQISMHSGSKGNIFTHVQVCQCLHETGLPEIPESKEAHDERNDS